MKYKSWEDEFDDKFNHFNEDESEGVDGKRICDWDCENSYTLEDVKKFIRKLLKKQ